MSLRRESLAVLIFTEDAASDAHATVGAIAKKMFRLVVPTCETQRIRFDPPDNPAALKAARANKWKSTAPEDREAVVSLRRYIATTLAQPNSFVIFHADADRTWSDSNQSENRRKFQSLIKDQVLNLLTSSEALRRRQCAPKPDASPVGPPIDPTEAITKLLLLCPCYSIEAWLFQNTVVGSELCVEHHRCGNHRQLFDAWRADRGALDEVFQPKEVICFGSRHNAQLATRAFPADEVYRAEKSFAASVRVLSQCASLVQALELTAVASP